MAKKEPARGPSSDAPRVSGPEPIMLGGREAMYTVVACPVCKAADSTLWTVSLDIPYFGEVLQTVFLCPRCGFRHTDTVIPRVGQAVEYEIRVESDEDLFTRVVKSSSATVDVPDLGLLWEPGPASLAAVTNVEGLLRRFEDAVNRAMVLSDSQEVNARGLEILQEIAEVIDNKRPVTLRLKDPYGNSAILDPRGKAKKRQLAREEAAALKTGEFVLELAGGEPPVLRRTDLA